MILNDAINEYKFVYDTLLPCENYFGTANTLITKYFSDISQATSNFFRTNNNDSSRNTLVSSLTNALATSYNQITVLITTSYEFYGALKILESYTFVNKDLSELVDKFTTSAHEAIIATNSIIKAQLPGMKTEQLLIKLISPLQDTIKTYYTLMNLYHQFEAVNKMLLEPLPEDVIDNPIYNELSIQALNPSADIEQVSGSLVELSCFFDNLGRLCNTTDKKDYYLRKVETGSLLTTFVIVASLFVSTIKLIDFCYPKFIKWRQLYFTDKTEQLKLSSAEIAAVKELLEFNPDIENADELIEIASVRLFKYFKINPRFKVNGKEYTTNIDIQLLEKTED